MGRKAKPITVISAKGREVTFESRGEFYHKTLGYWPSGKVMKAFVDGGQIGGYRLKVDAPLVAVPKELTDVKLEIIEEIKKAEKVVELTEEKIKIAIVEQPKPEIKSFDSKEMYIDLSLGCKKFCEKYGATEENFYKLHYKAMSTLTEMEGFYKVMCGYPVNLNDVSRFDKALSTAYHEIEFSKSTDIDVIKARYEKIENILEGRRALKTARDFQKFIVHHKNRRAEIVMKEEENNND